MTSDATPSFSQLGLPDSICTTLMRLGYERPSPIQERSIGPLLAGRDLLGVAQTGTGKTAAFALPLLSQVDQSATYPVVLILTPTRELGIQVAEAIETYAETLTGLKVLPVYGGQDMGTQVRQLKKGPQIIVGTPGRLMDHVRRKTLKLANIKHVVLDEADEMLRMGFIDDVEWILEQTPKTRQLALFSATMPAAIKRIVNKYLQNPEEVRIQSATKTVDRIQQTYIEVNNSRKLAALDLVLETEEFDGVMVFVRTKTSAQELAQKLEMKGYRASSIHGDLNQRQRELCIRQLKDAVIDVVVATDVAARGIDVSRITHVVNYDVPYDGESYIHRIGRTGRAGRSGKAILFVAQRERRMLNTIERTTGQKVPPMQLPTADQLKQVRLDRFADNLKKTLEKAPVESLRSSLRQIHESTGLDFEEIALALSYQTPGGRNLVVNDRDLSMTGGKPMSGKNGRVKESGARDGNKKRRKPEKRQVQEVEGVPMEAYRLDVGRDHSVRVGDILGAVANELGLDSQYIGEIKLEGTSSVIELPKDMPKDLFQQFRKIRIRNYPAKPELLDEKAPKARKKPRSEIAGGKAGSSKKEGSKSQNKAVKSKETKNKGSKTKSLKAKGSETKKTKNKDNLGSSSSKAKKPTSPRKRKSS